MGWSSCTANCITYSTSVCLYDMVTISAIEDVIVQLCEPYLNNNWGDLFALLIASLGTPLSVLAIRWWHRSFTATLTIVWLPVIFIANQGRTFGWCGLFALLTALPRTVLYFSPEILWQQLLHITRHPHNECMVSNYICRESTQQGWESVTCSASYIVNAPATTGII